MAVESFCRLCASKSENYVKIYEEEGEQLKLATKIIQCLHIWLKPDDILPKTVCMDCCLKLDQYFDFFELCTRSQKSLMAIFDENKETVINKYDNDIGNQDDYFMKSISVVFNNNNANVIANTPEITNPLNNGNGDSNVIYEDIGDENNYQDGEVEDEYNDCEGDGYEFKLKVGVNCNGDYNEEYLQAGDAEGGGDNNPDENSQYNNVNSVLNENRGTSRRKLRIPVKRSSKNQNNDIGKTIKGKKSRSNIAKKRPTRRCSVKSIGKKLKPVPKTLSNRIEAAANTNDYNCKSKNNYNDEVRDDQDESLRKKDEEEEEDSAEKTNRFNCNRKLMDGYIWKCTDCTAELKTLSALKDHHQVMHKQPPNFKCSYCTKVYTRYRSFARHIKLHGNPKKFSCEVCGKGFSQKTVLQSHRTVHTEERPHVCPQCGKAFKQFSSLYLHSKCHLPEEIKPKFPCSICPKQFSTKHTLETHMKIHTGERNYICDICGKSFIAKGSLDYHILAHNDSKPHNCAVCNKGFKTARLLTKHSSLHTGIKPHQCDVCGKQFRERSALKEHNRIHTGAMPYACEFCGKLFRFKGILTVHRRQHTGERPYSCQDCRREFTNWANYNKHMKRRHRNTENNQNGQSANSVPSNRLTVRQDLQAQQSTEQTLHHLSSQPCAVQHGAQHVITVMPQHQQPEDVEPPSISVQQLAPISNIQLHMQQPVIYNDNTSTTSNSDNGDYKLLPNDHANNINADVYRVSHYIPSHAITGMGYYIPPIHQPVLPTRNQ